MKILKCPVGKKGHYLNSLPLFLLLILINIVCVCVFFFSSFCCYCIHWMRITIGKVTEIHFNSIPFVFLVLFYLFLVFFFLSFHFDLNIQWQGDDGREREKKTTHSSMDAYGNLTLGMGIKMQFKSICLFAFETYRDSMEMNK